MQHLDRRNLLQVIIGTATASTLPGSDTEAAEPAQPKPEGEIKIPASLRAEHEEIHEELVRLTNSGGKTGKAAEAVARALHPHFRREEELAMPPLGLLQPLAHGHIRPQMVKVLELTDKLKKELPSMLKEHEVIVGTLRALAEAGKQENKPEAQQFALKLEQHARSEEEVLYPAAILVGEYLKLKLSK